MGTIGAEDAAELFLLLPMTDAEGCVIVRDRIIETAAGNIFTVAGKSVSAEVKVSVTAPDERTKDLKSYLAVARENHKAC